MAENNKIIYFDNAASTEVDKNILLEYNNINSKYFANPSSPHKLAYEISYLYENNKNEILKLFNCPSHNFIFTSSASEANNLALKGIAFMYQNRGKHIISAKNEHPSILETLKQLESFGFDVTYLDVNESGVIDIEQLKTTIRKDTILVSLMVANNETGAINPIKQIIEVIKNYPKIYLHVDAVQAVGKIDLDYKDIDLFTISAHKIHGLKGEGGLAIKNNIKLFPLICGGGQQDGFRSGTIDYANAFCLTKAVSNAFKNRRNSGEIAKINKIIYDYLINNADEYAINSKMVDVNPYILNFSLKRKKASVVVEALSNNNICVSTKSSCHSKSNNESYVIYEQTKDHLLSSNSIRLSFSHLNSVEEANYFVQILDKIIKEIKQ